MTIKKVKYRVVQLDSRGKRKVETYSKDLTETIRKQVELRLPNLVAGEIYTLRKICGEDFWSDQVNGEETYAGRCMSLLVEASRLPLIHAGRNGKNSAQYRLK